MKTTEFLSLRNRIRRATNFNWVGLIGVSLISFSIGFFILANWSFLSLMYHYLSVDVALLSFDEKLYLLFRTVVTLIYFLLSFFFQDLWGYIRGVQWAEKEFFKEHGVRLE